MLEQCALWAGTDEGGGIATYIRVMQQTPLWSEWNIRHVVTHRDGSAAAKIWTFVRGGLLFVFELIRSRPERGPPAFRQRHQLHPEGNPVVDEPVRSYLSSCTYTGRTSTSSTRIHLA